MRILLVLLPALCWLGCAGPAPSHTAHNVLTVEGRVSVRGHTPFTGVLLETDQRNFYVLALDEAARRDLVPELPARYRVTGLLYGADWNGIRYAHLRPTKMEPLGR